jgi:hypothetical protein
VSSALGSEDDNTLKCIAKELKDKGVNEEFLSSVSTNIDSINNCNDLIEAKLTKGFGKIRDRLDADMYFSKYSSCIMKAINTETNRIIVLRREAIKIKAKFWNHFSQREHLDELKKEIDSAINTALTQKCLFVY